MNNTDFLEDIAISLRIISGVMVQANLWKCANIHIEQIDESDRQYYERLAKFIGMEFRDGYLCRPASLE